VVDETDLAAYVGASPSEVTLPGLLAAATDLVDEHLGPAGLARIPATIRDNAYLQLASELYARRNAPGGIVTYGGTEVGGGMRLSRDPMASVRATLAPYRPLVVG
jgi:hypothetical protein